MSTINLHFVTIPGKRILITLSKEFQLTDLLHMIRSQINDNAVEDCIFFCKGRRLILNDPVAFQNQKSKLINNGDVILIGKRISSCEQSQTIREENKVNVRRRIPFFLLFSSIYLERYLNHIVFCNNFWRTIRIEDP